MKVEKKASGGCTVDLSVTAGPEEVAAECKKVLDMFAREAAIPGFRKGKVPLALIKQKFADGIDKESKEACFRKFYPQAVKESGVDEVALAGVTAISLDGEKGFSFTASVEVRPEFKLPKYKKLAIKAGDTTVKEEDVDRELDTMRKNFATYENAAEGAAIGEGDFANFDYKGSLEGKPLSEIVPDQKALCSAEGFWAMVEEGRFLPEIIEALKGMKAGETKTGIMVKFPDEAAPEPLKGKTCEYDITVKEFRSRTLPDDAALAARVKQPDIEAVRKNIREQMEKAAVAGDVENRRNQAIELMLSDAKFDVPDSLVRRQMQNYLRELEQRAKYAGLSGDYIEQNTDKILADARTHAEQQVRLSYILEEIAKAESIEASEDDLDKAFEKIASSQREPVTAADVRKHYEEGGAIEAVKDQVRAEKAIDFVVNAAK